jgi:hypothetical protein
MSSAAATFTPQDLAAQATKVFDAVRRFGSAEIRTQDGETFVMAKATNAPATTSTHEEVIARMKAHYQKLRDLGHFPAVAEDQEHINQIIAGEV